MQQELFPSVKISYFNTEMVWNALRRFVAELAEKHEEIKQIFLFGSFARGDSVPGSDVDLLIVLSESDKSFLDRISEYMPSKFPVGVDVFPYTETELEYMIKDSNFFLRQALGEGIVLLNKQGEWIEN